MVVSDRIGASMLLMDRYDADLTTGTRRLTSRFQLLDGQEILIGPTTCILRLSRTEAVPSL